MKKQTEVADQEVSPVRVYVVGAGVSCAAAGYPLGGALFDELDKFVQGMGNWGHRFDYGEEWPELLDRLRDNSNPLIAEAYRARKLEHLFTVLDLAQKLSSENFDSVAQAGYESIESARRAETNYNAFKERIEPYRHYRKVLLFALERYFNFLHDRDANYTGTWKELEAFGQRLCPGDVVITFNYDATLERVLLRQGKWSPRDGYGFDIEFQRSEVDETPLVIDPSVTIILHLHGAVGWYSKPVFRVEPRQSSGGPISRDELSPGPLETPIALNNQFLRLLGFPGVDASLPIPRNQEEDQILLQPSFLKDYEMGAEYQNPFPELWRKAAKALRRADEVFIIGYSLPSEDTAALTLLLGNCDKNRIRIINQNVLHSFRLRKLLSGEFDPDPVSFDEWLGHG